MDQPLAASYPQDLGTLFETMPAFAASMAGENARLADENNPRLQQAFDAQQQYEQTQKRPADLAYTQAQTGHLNSGSALQAAQARLFGTQADVAEATKGGKVDAENATNRGTVSDQQLMDADRFGQRLGMAAAQMRAVPPAARPAWLRQNMGPDLQNHPEIADLVDKDPQNAHEQLGKLSYEMLQATGAARKESLRAQRELEKARVEGQYRVQSSQVLAGGRLAVEKAGIEGGKYNKNSTQFQLIKGLAGNFQQQAGAATELANRATDPEERDYYTQLAASAREQDQRSRASGAATTNEMKVPVAPFVGQPQPQAPGAAPVPQPPVRRAPKAQAPGNYVQGQVYKGKTGSYIYNGGDPKDPRNWTKQ